MFFNRYLTTIWSAFFFVFLAVMYLLASNARNARVRIENDNRYVHGVVLAKCLPFTWMHCSTHSSFPCCLWCVFVVVCAYVHCDVQVRLTLCCPFMSSSCPMRVVRSYGVENDYRYVHGVVGYAFVGFDILRYCWIFFIK